MHSSINYITVLYSAGAKHKLPMIATIRDITPHESIRGAGSPEPLSFQTNSWGSRAREPFIVMSAINR